MKFTAKSTISETYGLSDTEWLILMSTLRHKYKQYNTLTDFVEEEFSDIDYEIRLKICACMRL